MTESKQDEALRMRKAVEVYNMIADSLRIAALMLPKWLPVRAAVSEVCGIDWDRLDHGKRTVIGSRVRDWFAEEFPQFQLTPVRLLAKSSGSGSHMIAIYPLDWLIAKKESMLQVLGESPSSNCLPFRET